MIEKITHNDLILAIIIRGNFKKKGIEFFTPKHFSQQLGYMCRPKGHVVEPHSHRLVERKVSLTQEVLFVKSGKIKIELFDSDQTFVEECIVTTGDTILLATGGHGLEMLEDSELIEIKQGPYVNDDDKVRFTTVIENNEHKSHI